MCRPNEQPDPIQQIEKTIPDAFRRSRFRIARMNGESNYVMNNSRLHPGEELIRCPEQSNNRYFFMQMIFETRLYTPFSTARTGTGFIIMRVRFGLDVSPSNYLQQARQAFIDFEEAQENEYS